MSGSVVWITGLPSSGKSTLAELALAGLHERGVPACLLDGDAVRASLVPPVGYGPDARRDFYETLARLASLLARQGLVVLVPATAHRRCFRERACELAPHYLEVWVDTPREECERRDSKGLYAAGHVGRTPGVPGLDEPYEPPTSADIIARPEAAPEALAELWAKLGLRHLVGRFGPPSRVE